MKNTYTKFNILLLLLLLLSWTLRAGVYTTYCDGELTEGICSPTWSGTTVMKNDTVIVRHTTFVTKNFTINGTVIVEGESILTVDNNLKIAKGGMLMINGLLIGKKIENDGTIVNNGNMIVFGNIVNNGTGIIKGTAGKIFVEGNIVNNSGGLITGNISLCNFDGTTNPLVSNTGTVNFGTVAICGVILPVELISFSANLIHGNVVLQWATSSEINVSHFEIERSYDAESFNKVAEILSAGDSRIIREYNYTDNPIETEHIYYRLKMVDKDGSLAYSNVEAILNSGGSIAVFPNPVNTGQEINIKMAGESEAMIQVMDHNGRKVIESLNLINGHCTIQGNDLSPGIYYVLLNGKDKIYKSQLIVK